MIWDTKQKTIVGRKDFDENQTEQVRSGARQWAFVAEFNAKIKHGGLSWFQGIIKAWDEACVKKLTKENKQEHTEAFALQRDVNYAYSTRKRLLHVGHDSRFEEHFMAKFKSEVQKEK